MLAPSLNRLPLVPALLATGCLGFLLVLLLVGDAERGVVASLGLCLGQAGCALLLLVRRTDEQHGMRRVWRLLGAATLSSAGILAVWTFYAVRYGALPPVPSPADAFFLPAVALPLAAAAVWPTAARRGSDLLRPLLDGAVISASLVLIAWAFVIGPTVEAASTGRLSLATSLAVVYPVADVLAVAAALFAALRARPGTRAPAMYVLAALSVYAFSDGLFALQAATGTAGYATATMVLWLVAPALLVSGRFAGRGPAADEPRTQPMAVTRTLVVLPMLPVAFALVSAIARPGTDTTVLGTLLVSLLVVRYAVLELVAANLVSRLEADALTENAFLEATLKQMSEPLLACDAGGRVRFANDAMVALFPEVQVGVQVGQTRHGTDIHDLDGSRVPTDDLPLMAALRGEQQPERLLVARAPSGLERVIRAAGRPIRDGSQAVVGAVLVTHDVTESRREQQRLLKQAMTDELTGLGNRLQFQEDLADVLAGDNAATVAVLLLDLDDFKNVNDSLGHSIGDELLVAVADRIRHVLRAGDGAARLGGDEFVVLLHDCDQQGAVGVAEMLLSALDAPVVVAGVELSLSASIGVTMCNATTDCESTLSAAELAMYLAKQRGKGGVAVFEPGMQEGAQERLSLENDLRRALRNEGLHLAYQPIVDLTTGAMSGVEALVRWQDPVRGSVSPAEFIPIAEDSGLVLPLGEWVLSEAVRQLRRWNAQSPQSRLVVCVNVSTRQLERPGLLSTIDTLIARGLDPAQLVLEITETALGLDDEVAMRTLHALRDRGIHLAVDDFGTGYSSLSRLRAAPVSRLKIDRSFVNEIVHGGSDVPIVDATMAMSRGLGLGVVAEGVETEAQLNYLRRLGCGQAQGYLLARPMPAASVDDVLGGDVPWAGLLQGTAEASRTPADQLGHLLDLAIASNVDVEQLVRPLLDDLSRLTGLTATYLTRLTPDGRQQQIEYTNSDPEPNLVEGALVEWEDSLCMRSLTRGIPRTDDAVSAFPDTGVAAALGITSYLAEPLYDQQGRLYGTLCGAASTAVGLTEADSATARLFARLVAEKLHSVTSRVEDAAAGPALCQGSNPVERSDSGTERRADLERRRRTARRRWDAARAAEMPSSGRTALQASSRLRRQAEDVLVQRSAELAVAGADTADPCLLRVMVADDDGVIRAIAAGLVAQEPTMALVAEAHTGAAAIGIAVAEQPEVIVLDYDLGDMTAPDIVPELRRFAPGARILLYSGRDDVHQIGQRLGIDRSVRKLDGFGRLQEALQSFALGGARTETPPLDGPRTQGRQDTPATAVAGS